MATKRYLTLSAVLVCALAHTGAVAVEKPLLSTQSLVNKTVLVQSANRRAKSKSSSSKANKKITKSQRKAWTLADELGQRIVSAAKKPRQTKKYFVAEVEGLLSTLIDFKVFTTNVVGKYGTKEYIRALPRKRRSNHEKQIARFSDVFKQQLIDVYSTTFWNVAKKVSLKTLEPTASSKPNQQIIRQEIHGVSEQPVLIYYQMVLTNNDWQIKNLAVQGVNLAKIYRQQFYDLMKEHDDNINKVVDAWDIS